MILQIQPWIDNSEMDELRKVIESTMITEGKVTKQFEQLTSELTSSPFAVAMTNGTAALYCCLKALNIGPGDEVIVPNITFIATANAVIMAGATPIFCEVRSDTFCIDIKKASELVTSKTKAIMPVHLYGQAADMDEVMAFAQRQKIYVVEDAAQGVGVLFKGQHVGTFGDLGILSYYGNKTITCAEGGIVLTGSQELAQSCYRLKNHGRDKKGTFIHDHIGFNFSFTEMQAAIGVSQMHKLPQIISKKRAIYDRYCEELSDLNEFKPVFIDDRCKPVFWFTSFLADDATKLGGHLLEKGIQTRRFFYPLHLQPCYKNLIRKTQYFSLSERIYHQGISLPSSYSLTYEEQSQVISEIKKYYQ